jgi:hypothetical protein
MDKKDLKFYEAPAQDVIDLELEGFLCTSDPEDVHVGEDDEPGFED